MVTIKELKNKIKHLDENMLVGGAGWFGEFLECEFAEVKTLSKKEFALSPKEKDEDKITIFCIDLEYAGEEPD